jgi:predicted RND superfamily exporter protein
MTWVFSDIKFQADMGLLLAFMFLWNMVGAIVMLPALVAILMPREAPRCRMSEAASKAVGGFHLSE